MLLLSSTFDISIKFEVLGRGFIEILTDLTCKIIFNHKELVYIPVAASFAPKLVL